MRAPRKGCGAAGFTLVELVVTLMIVAVLAIFAIPRFFDRQTFDARAYADQAQAMLRFAQKLAVAQNRNVYARLNGTSIALCFDSACSPSARISAPAGGNSGSSATLAACGNSSTWYCEAVPDGVSYSTSPVTGGFFFNGLGKPYLPGNTPPDSTFTGLGVAVVGGGVNSLVTVERETGYVH